MEHIVTLLLGNVPKAVKKIGMDRNVTVRIIIFFVLLSSISKLAKILNGNHFQKY